MNKALIGIFVFSIFFNSCQQQQAEKSEMQAKIDSLEIVAQQKDNAAMEFLSVYNDVQENLDEILEAEGFIKSRSENIDEVPDARKQITDDIQRIHELMLENKQKIESLERKLIASNSKNKEFQKLIATLKAQLEEKNKEIASLNEQLSLLNIQVTGLEFRVDTLRTEIVSKDKLIDEQLEEINTAFYVFGTEKELKEQNILTKEGGFIGIGKNVKLIQDFNTNYFTKVDIRDLKEIKLMVSKAKIITNHPSGTFKLKQTKEGVDKLLILKPNEFWRTSKYLVIIVEN